MSFGVRWAFLFAFAGQLIGQDPTTYKKLTLDQLGQVEVVSVGRRETPVIESAAAIYAISQEDIRRSGVRTIPEALRLAPGIQVAIFNNGSWEVTARGFNNTSSDKMQVFLDGRSLYTPLFGGVLWDAQNTMMQDIERIEVIRGPGATLWGGNAVNGVINIITKTAKNTQGGLLVAGGGLGETGFADVRYGGKLGDNTFYRLYTTFNNRGALELANGTSAHDEYQNEQAGFRTETALTKSDTLTMQGDLYRATEGFIARPDISLHGGNVLSRWTHHFQNSSELQVQAYYDRTSRLVPQVFNEIRNTYDIDLQYAFHAGDSNDLVAGAGYRVSNSGTVAQPTLFFNPSGRHLELGNVFLQDQISFYGNRLHLTLGTKFENNTYSGWEVQPTARLAWTPSKHQTLWGAVSRAVRIPTEFDEDLRIASGSTILIRGDSNFRSERVISTEVGYRIVPTKRFGFGIATYYNLYDNLRSQEPTPLVVLPFVLSNKVHGRTYGLEPNFLYEVQPWWRIFAGYSNLQKSLVPDSDSRDTTSGLQEGLDPRNQFQFRSNMDLPHKIELDFWLRHSSALETAAAPVQPYTVFDVRAGWHLSESTVISIIGRNLSNRSHAEFGPTGELVRPTVYLRLIWAF